MFTVTATMIADDVAKLSALALWCLSYGMTNLEILRTNAAFVNAIERPTERCDYVVTQIASLSANVISNSMHLAKVLMVLRFTMLKLEVSIFSQFIFSGLSACTTEIG